MADELTEISPATFRQVLGHFCSGITVVTAVADGTPAGLTCQSFFSVSLDPPLVAFSSARTSKSYPAIRRAQSFCINILAHGQERLSTAFARSGEDKWRGVSWQPAGRTGSPILDGVLAWVECATVAEHEAGDHFLTIGRVLSLEHSGATEPLLYFRGAYGRLAA
ncbi:flavin reductase family protein [Phytohabitans sp. ZYX-F-186]|uniref:Flavin reductase family protein n=1 Tax=Phytohabitans maris TaxID=3071409 RepID=A0ABU0ZTR3_9ACTN|nr:flavin reductase family protein [Phytohabitans sp. ZYX-F-186]MDQ7910377.1 flavin reductase family protein [Phytohabitans sp. ZYX-F-186]